jgi:divalent metal cation (Fe/Co/Zn/Cd) transporter
MDEVLTPSASEHSSPSGWRASRRDPQLRVYWNVFWANLALCVFELASGAAGYGPLLVVDGLASAAIAAVVTTILFGVELSRPQVVTAAYPYGKGKVQYLTALAFGALLAAAGAGVLALSIKSFFGPTELGPLAIGMAVAGVSLVSNVLLLLYLRAELGAVRAGRMVLAGAHGHRDHLPHHDVAQRADYPARSRRHHGSEWGL